MYAGIERIEGIGPQVVAIFHKARFRTVQDLHNFDADDRRVWQAIQERRKEDQVDFGDAYYQRLMTRCINVIYRVRSAEASDFVPYEYMCPLTLDWYQDPMVVSSGMSYSREALKTHLRTSRQCPVTRTDISEIPMYDNIALRNAVLHYRMHHHRFRILC